jgi:hypothetical protein
MFNWLDDKVDRIKIKSKYIYFFKKYSNYGLVVFIKISRTKGGIDLLIRYNTKSKKKWGVLVPMLH